MEKMIFLVDLCFGDDTRDEILAFIIRKDQVDAAQAIVTATKETWWDNDDPETFDEAIERGLKDAGVWFERTEYYVAWVNYYE